jgi:predicted ATPase/DNA-binding SARP family transcriptional activator
VEFRVLGPPEVVAAGQPLELGTPRQRTLLGLLLLHAGEVVSYDRLVEDLWDGNPPATARHTLQGYVHRLRRTLGADAWRLITRPPGYQLKVATGELDAQRFQDLATAGRHALVRDDPQAAADQLAVGLSLWRGPLLADLDEVAALAPERARLEALRLTALEDRIEADLALGGHGGLVAELEALLADHPYRERLWGQLMLALYRSGRQADALQAFHRARQVLDEELGLEPSRWLRRRQEQILLQDPALEQPDPTPPPRPPHHLPAQRTRFVGRRRELAELQGLLQTRRLVCVTGPPGSGKTRLAVEIAASLLEAFPHGAWFVSLAEVAEPELVRSAVGTALAVPELPERPAAQALTDHLRSRRLLLVLDNFEHLLPAAVRVAELLDAAPGLTVLATSRAPLRLSGEQEYPLAPLPLPLPRPDAPAGLLGNDALALFADRAAAVDPHFVLGADNAPLVAEVVARLDGLPLAIELAAARLRLFSLEELARRLSPALPQLSGGPVDHAARQRTLRDAIAWSDRLLGPAERALLRRLGVFQGGFTLQAAEAVAQGPPVTDLMADLATLIEASLLIRPMGPGEPRFWMLETIREYALEQLEAAGEDQDTGARHARFYAGLVEQAEPELTGADQERWLERLQAEHANLQAALRWASQTGDTDLALLMAARLWRFWQLRGHFAEGRRWLEEVLAAEGPASVPRAKALIGLAGLCYWQGDWDAAEAAYGQARELAKGLEDWWLELEALFGVAFTLACHRGELQAAAPIEQQFQAIIAEHPEPLAIGLGLATSQMMRLFAGDLDGSRAYGEQCLAGTRALGERWYESQILRTLALTSMLQGRYQQAERELRECLEVAVELGDLAGVALDLDRLGQAAVALGQPERAVVLAGAGDRLRESVGGGLTVESGRWETEHPRDAARRQLTDTEIDRAWAQGRTMGLEDVVAYVRTA